MSQDDTTTGARWGGRQQVFLSVQAVVAVVIAAMMAWMTVGAASANQLPSPFSTAQVIADSGLNLRTAPSLQAPVILTIPYLAHVQVHGEAVTEDSHAWVPVQVATADGPRLGWVAAEWLLTTSPATVAAAPTLQSAVPVSSEPPPSGIPLSGVELLKGPGPDQYAVHDGIRYPIADLPTLAVLNLGGYRTVPDEVLARLHPGPTLHLRPGTLLRGTDGRVWLVGADSSRHWVPDLETFYALGFAWSQVYQTAAWVLSRVPLGDPVTKPRRPVGQALGWARARLGWSNWNRLCQLFVEAAYGTGTQYLTAWRARQALVLDRSPQGWRRAPLGALLFFRPDASNDGNGHVGLHLGNGRMVSATYTGVKETDFAQDAYWRRMYAGWGLPQFDS